MKPTKLVRANETAAYLREQLAGAEARCAALEACLLEYLEQYCGSVQIGFDYTWANKARALLARDAKKEGK